MSLIFRAVLFLFGETKVVKEKKMKKIVLDLQSGLYAKLLERALLQELDDYLIIISKSPEMTFDICQTHQPSVVMLEVTRYTPWTILERNSLADIIRKNITGCKIIFITDGDTDKKLAEQIINAKLEGHADAIVFTSVNEKYLAAVIESL